jgi:hypothetical protein
MHYTVLVIFTCPLTYSRVQRHVSACTRDTAAWPNYKERQPHHLHCSQAAELRLAELEEAIASAHKASAMASELAHRRHEEEARLAAVQQVGDLILWSDCGRAAHSDGRWSMKS